MLTTVVVPKKLTSAPGPSDWTTLSGRLDWIVRERGFGSDRELGRAAGLSKAYISMLKSGVRGKKPLGDDVAEAIAKAADVSVAWLKAGEGRPDSSAAPTEPAAAPPPPPRDLLDRLRRGGHKDNRPAQAVLLLRDWLLPEAGEALLLEPPHDDWSLDQWLDLAREINARAKRLRAEIGERPSQQQPAAPRLSS